MAGAPGAPIAGRVGIKVLPDTSRFKEKLRRDLKRDTRGAVKIRVKPDGQRLKQDIRKLLRTTQAYLNRPRQALKVNLQVRTRQATAEIIAFIRRWQGEDVSMGVGVNERSIRRIEYQVARAVRRGIDRGTAGDVEDEDDETRDPERRGGKPDAKRRKRSTSKLFNLARLAKNLAAALALVKVFGIAVARILRKAASVFAKKLLQDLAVLSGARLAKNFLRPLKTLIENVDIFSAKLIVAAAAVIIFKSAIVVLTSNILVLGKGITQSLGAILALPSILLTAGVGIALVVRAMKDLDRVVPNLEDRLKAIGKNVSRSFWTEAADATRGFADSVIPVFNKSLSKASGIIGKAFPVFLEFLDRLVNSHAEEVIVNLSIAFATFLRQSEGFFRGIFDFIRFAARYAASEASRFTQWLNRFGRWLSRNSNGGGFRKTLETGIYQLGQLMRLLRAFGRTLAIIATAAEQATNTSLRGMAETLERVNRALTSTVGNKRLKSFFAANQKGFDMFVKTAGPALRKLFIKSLDFGEFLLPKLGKFGGSIVSSFANILSSEEVGRGFTHLLNKAQQFWDRVGPEFERLSVVFGGLLTIGGEIIKNAGILLKPIVAEIPALFSVVAPYIQRFLNESTAILLPLIMQVIDRIKAIDPGFFDKLANLALDVIKALAPLIPPLLDILIKLAPPLLDILDRVVQWLAPIIQSIADWLPNLLNWDGGNVQSAVNGVKRLWDDLKNSTVIQDWKDSFNGGELDPSNLKARFKPLLDEMKENLGDVLKEAAANTASLGLAMTEGVVPPLEQIVALINDLMSGPTGELIKFLLGLVTLGVAGTFPILTTLVGILRILVAIIDDILTQLYHLPGFIAGNEESIRKSKESMQKVVDVLKDVIEDIGRSMEILGRFYQRLEQGPNNPFAWWRRAIGSIMDWFYSWLEKLPYAVRKFLGVEDQSNIKFLEDTVRDVDELNARSGQGGNPYLDAYSGKRDRYGNKYTTNVTINNSNLNRESVERILKPRDPLANHSHLGIH